MKYFNYILKFTYIFSLAITIIVIGMYIYAISLPKIDINSVNNITIYDNSEEVIFSGNGNKEWISLEDISPYLIDATISTEDKRFYSYGQYLENAFPHSVGPNYTGNSDSFAMAGN